MIRYGSYMTLLIQSLCDENIVGNILLSHALHDIFMSSEKTGIASPNLNPNDLLLFNINSHC